MTDLDVLFTQLPHSITELRMVQFETVDGSRIIVNIFEADKKSLMRALAKMLEIEERIEFRKRGNK